MDTILERIEEMILIFIITINIIWLYNQHNKNQYYKNQYYKRCIKKLIKRYIQDIKQIEKDKDFKYDNLRLNIKLFVIDLKKILKKEKK